MEDKLRPEYDLKSISVRKLSTERCDVAETAMQDDQVESSENMKKLQF